MKVESVDGIALGVSRQGAIFRVLIAVTVTIATGVALLLPTPAAHAQTIVGTERDDHIVGTARPDRIRALAGDDDVAARGGRDRVTGGPGDDIISLGPGARFEAASGGRGDDTIFGGDGSDIIQGGVGRDELNGGSRADGFAVDRGADIARGGPGNDEFEVDPDGRPDLIACGPGRDIVDFMNEREAFDRTTDCEVEVLQ